MLHKLLEPKVSIPLSRQRFSDRDLMGLILPIIMEQLLVLLVGIADTMMVSHVSEAAVSGTSLVNQLNNIFIYVFGALAAGGGVVAAQYVGKRDRDNGCLAASQLILLTALAGFLSMALAIGLRTQLLDLLFGRVERDVRAAALTYLILSALSFPALAVYTSGGALLRSMGKSRTLLYISVAMNCINVVGNAIGVFVLRAGVAGVAVPSIVARVFAAVCMLWVLLRPENDLHIRTRQIFCWRGDMQGRILGIAIPGGVENGLFQIAKVSISSIVALFGTVQIAANGVAQSFWSMAALFVTAMGYAFVTVIGQCMGAGDVEAADYYSRKLLRITYLGAVLWNTLFFLCVPLLLGLYELSPEAKHLVILLVLLHNAGNALVAPCTFSLSNGLRAAGDVKYTMFASIFATVVCRVAFSWLLGVWLNMGVVGVTIAMCLDWSIKAALVLLRYHSRKWTQFKVV